MTVIDYVRTLLKDVRFNCIGSSYCTETKRTFVLFEQERDRITKEDFLKDYTSLIEKIKEKYPYANIRESEIEEHDFYIEPLERWEDFEPYYERVYRADVLITFE